MVTQAECRARASMGMAWLDLTRPPDWDKAIPLSRVNIASDNDCILALASGTTYEKAARASGLTSAELTALGFVTRSHWRTTIVGNVVTVHSAHVLEEYAMLTQAFVELLTERRVQPASQEAAPVTA